MLSGQTANLSTGVSAGRAREIAAYIAERLRTPDLLMQAHKSSGSRTDVDLQGMRETRGLASGAAGIALLLAAMEKLEPDQGWTESVHAMFLYATSEPSDGSLYTGYAGFALCAEIVAQGTPRYGRMISQIADACSANVIATVAELQGTALPSSHCYEVIAGISGQLLALDPRRHAAAWNAATDFLDWMTEDSSRWFLGNAFDPDTPERNNIGVSHGIGGAMGVIALGPRSPKGLEVTRRIADYIRTCVIETEYGPQWPSMIGPGAPTNPSRVSWCYGAPGLSCTIYNAGVYLGDDLLVDLAVRSALALAKRPLETWGMVDEGLCHGAAGNAILLSRLARLTGLPELKSLTEVLYERVLAAFDPSLPLGYDTQMLVGRVDSPSFLEGAAGIAIALLTLSGQIDDRWLRTLAVA